MRPNRPGAAKCSSSTGAGLTRRAACKGIGGPSASRPSLINTTRCSVTWHAEQINVWFSTPRAATFCRGPRWSRSTRHHTRYNASLPLCLAPLVESAACYRVELVEFYRVRKPRMAEGLTGAFALLRDQVAVTPLSDVPHRSVLGYPSERSAACHRLRRSVKLPWSEILSRGGGRFHTLA
jgi:hypothetical protein